MDFMYVKGLTHESNEAYASCTPHFGPAPLLILWQTQNPKNTLAATFSPLLPHLRTLNLLCTPFEFVDVCCSPDKSHHRPPQ